MKAGIVWSRILQFSGVAPLPPFAKPCGLDPSTTPRMAWSLLTPRPKATEAGGRRLLLSPSQDQLVWVWGESLDHPEDAGTEAKTRLRVSIELGKGLRI
jgi:hypothetical protein